MRIKLLHLGSEAILRPEDRRECRPKRCQASLLQIIGVIFKADPEALPVS